MGQPWADAAGWALAWGVVAPNPWPPSLAREGGFLCGREEGLEEDLSNGPMNNPRDVRNVHESG